VLTETEALGALSVLAEALTMSPWQKGTSPPGSFVFRSAWAEYVPDGEPAGAAGKVRHRGAFPFAVAADAPGASVTTHNASATNSVIFLMGTPKSCPRGPGSVRRRRPPATR